MASNPSKPKRPPAPGASARRLLSVKDLHVLAKLPTAALAAWCLPERRWFDLCCRMASLRPADLERLAQRLAAVMGAGLPAGTAREVARRHQAFVRLDQLCFLRSHRPGGWNPALRLEGGQHLAAALAAGRQRIAKETGAWTSRQCSRANILGCLRARTRPARGRSLWAG